MTHTQKKTCSVYDIRTNFLFALCHCKKVHSAHIQSVRVLCRPAAMTSTDGHCADSLVCGPSLVPDDVTPGMRQEEELCGGGSNVRAAYASPWCPPGRVGGGGGGAAWLSANSVVGTARGATGHLRLAFVKFNYSAFLKGRAAETERSTSRPPLRGGKTRPFECGARCVVRFCFSFMLFVRTVQC